MTATERPTPGRADNYFEFTVVGTRPRRRISNTPSPKRKYRVRGAPSNAMTHSEFARAVGRHRTTVWRWAQRGWLSPAGARAGRSFYVRDQIDEFETIKLVRSAPVQRAIRALLAKGRRHV
jgi:hypothetical protein